MFYKFFILILLINTKQLIDAIEKILSKTKSWDRVIFYSTNIDHYKYLNQKYKHAKKFEARDYTRERNLNVILNNICNIQLNDPWIGLELRRDMIIKEKFLLGEGVNKINIKLWNKNVINCIKKLSKNVKIVLFGTNNISDYCESIKLGAYAIMTDYPKKNVKL